MASTPTLIGPLASRQINQTFYVGYGDLTNIQKAVNVAIAAGGGTVIVPWLYAGGDSIGAVTGGQDHVGIRDYRQPSVQAWFWNDTSLVYQPADIDQIADIYARNINASQALTAQTISAGEINQTFYVGQGSYTNIQTTVNAAIAAGGGIVIVPWLYAGGDSIGAVTGGQDHVGIKDYRQPSVQAWFWNDTSLVYQPADIDQIADIYARNINASQALTGASAAISGNMTVGGTLSVSGGITGPLQINGNLTATGSIGAASASITGNLTSNDAKFATCEVANSPVRTFANTADAPAGQIWPPIGIAVSAGSTWGTSIDPASLATYPSAGIAVSTGTAWGTPINPATLQGKLTLTTTGTSGASTLVGNSLNIPTYTAPAQVYPAAGIGVSNGSAWGTSINPADVPRLSTTNTFSGAILAAGGMNIAGNAQPIANSCRVSAASGTAFIDSQGANTTTTGILSLRILSSDYSVGYELIRLANATVYFGGGTATLDTSGNFHCNGTFTAGTKNFRITHPLDDTKNLTHSCLEGPEVGVYYRGEAVIVDGYAVVTLPDYFEALTFPEDRSVQLTQIWEDAPVFARYAASRVVDGQFTIHATENVTIAWEVKAVRRAGVERLQVETMKPIEPEVVWNDSTDTDRSGTPEDGKPKSKKVRA